MNDRLKFRVWGKKEKKYLLKRTVFIERANFFMFGTPDGMASSQLEHCIAHPEYFVLEQYTGLKDKNGKLIYEGDIVDLLTEIDETAVIEWDEVTACFCVVSKSGGFTATFDNYRGDDLEIIGNIHETPELLEGKK